MKRYIFNFAFASLTVLLAGCLSGCSSASGIQPSQATTNLLLQNLQNHQYKAAYGLLSSKCKAATTLPQFQTYWGVVEKNRGLIQSWTQKSVQVSDGTNGSSVTLIYTLKCAKGSSGAQFICIEENNRWVILRLNFSG